MAKLPYDVVKFAGFEVFGGATVTRLYDDLGNEFYSLCARHKASNKFGFFIFKNRQVIGDPTDPVAGGRGSINRAGQFQAFNEAELREGAIPGWNTPR